MASNLLQKFFFQFMLPLTLIGACLLRYNGLSGVYLLCLLFIPLLPCPGGTSSRSPIILQCIIFCISILFTFIQIVFQVVMIADQPYGHFFNQCSNFGIIANQIGFNRYDNSSITDIIRLLAPDAIVFLISMFSVLSCRNLPPGPAPRQIDGSFPHEEILYRQCYAAPLEEVVPLFVALTMLLGGIMQPNVFSAVYFLTFLLLGICWAFHLNDYIQKSSMYTLIKILLNVYAGLHIILLYLYQFPFFQNVLNPEDFKARLLGLTAIINNTDCSRSTEMIIVQTLPWPFYIYPFMIFVLYCCLAVENRLRFLKDCQFSIREKVSYPWWHPASWRKDKEISPLLDNTAIASHYGTVENTDADDPTVVKTIEETVEPIHIQSTFSSIVMFLTRQSYIAALITMMAWSITYHSWLTFVLLLWACVSWITPFARRFCMLLSPYLVIYADLLLIIQYLYGMNLQDNELPVSDGSFNFSELGMIRSKYPVINLGAQTMFTWVFLVTLRQHLREKKMNRRKMNSPNGAVVLTTIARPVIAAFKKRVNYTSSKRKVDKIEEVEHGMSPSDDAKEFMAWVKSTLSKYWILFCCFAFLLVALQNEVSLYQIFYMVIFLMVFIIYQFSVWVWKAVLRPLWWFMVIYSIVILLTIYTYQFENMPQYWMNGTHLSSQWLYDIGLRQQSKTSLLLELLVPTVFSIVIVIQLHFFHKPLMMKINRLLRYRKEKQRKIKHRSIDSLSNNQTIYTSDDNIPSTSNPASSNVTTEGTESTSDELDSENSHNTLTKIRILYVKTSVILWRLAEIHISKCIYFVTILVVIQQISVINGVFMVLVALAMPSSHLQKFIDYILIVWSSITVLVFMFYQLKFVDEDLLDINCTALTNKSFPTPAPNSHFVNNAWWVGFHKVEAVRSDVRGYLFIVIFVVLKKVIKHHQELYRYRKNLEIPRQGVLFDGITRRMADEKLCSCVKYLCNNFFNLFGIEINLMVIVLSMSIRSDAIAVLHSLWVALFLSFRRKNLYKIWPFYVGYMAVLLPLQYVVILGWPPGLCKGYPWDDLDPHSIVQWFYLTDVENPQDQYLLFAEYFQFLMACCQANSFANDATIYKNNSASSTSITPEADEKYIPPDFMNNKTWLDFIKIVFLDQFLWITLTVVYITAQSTTSLFNSGFIVGCFFFLWHGQGMYLRPRAQIKKWWKTLITYNFFVIVAKVWLQLVSCVFITSIYNKTDCYLIQLLNLYCTRKKVYHIENHPMNKEQCINEGDTGLIMDSICFMVILIQYRIFHSPYFKYVVRDHRRQSDMASRGAQLVEQRLQIRLTNSKQSDAENMARIKKKVMKARQKLKALQEQVNPSAQEPTSHYEAIYSGDAYLFEDSETDSDSDSKDGVESADVSIFLLPKATSEQHVCGLFPADDTIPTFHHTEDEDSAQPENLVIVSSAEPAGKDDAIQTDGLRQRHITKSPHEPPQAYSCDSQDEMYASASYEANMSSTFRVKVKDGIDAARKVFYDFAESATKFFNKSSADYRSITTQLAAERKEQSRIHLNTNFPSVVESEDKGSGFEGSSSASSKMEEDTDTWAMIDTVEENEVTWKKDHCAVSCAVAFYYALLANTDWLCYALMIINHMYYASVLSVPLPFFVFLWGLLSIPRPTKRFWIAVITYVELVIVVKYILQFQFPKQNSFNECRFYGPKAEVNPLCPPRIIGIERLRDSSVIDLVLLLCLFFHRYSLKIHGLWREKSYFDDEEITPCPSQATGSLADNTNPIKTGDTDVTGTTSSLQFQQDSNKGSPIKTQNSFQKKSMLQNMKNFVSRIHNPEVGTGAVDVYAWMFCAQFIIFCIILFSWSSFSSSSQETDSNFAKIIEGDAVPQTFLYLLLTWFLVIVFDRCLYMKKTVIAKLVYNAVLTFVVHAFLFIYVPALTQRGFTENIPAMLMYIFLCIYFMLSSYQVRCGYPTRILGNFLTKNYTIVSGILFQGMQAIPFLLELRSVLDWVLTKTTLTLSHWLKMEDIYANVFVIKCWRDSEKTWPHKRGEAYWKSSKWLIGGILVTLLVVVIWFPLLLMSFIKTAYISSRPVEVTFTLTLGGYQPLFKVTTQQQFLKELSQKEISQIINAYDDENPSWDANKVDEALRGYKKRGNLMSIKILSNSSAIWTISPPSRDVLIQDLESNSSISLRFKYVFSREQNTTQAAIVQETVAGVQTTPLHAGDPIRKEMIKVLRSPSGDGEVKLPSLFPTFIQVQASGPVKRVQWLGGGNMVNCTIVLRRGSVPHMNSTEVEWWEIIQDSPLPLFSHGPGYLEIIALNDLVPPLHLSFFASKGIIGLYVGFVWLVGKFVRLFFTSISYRIMFDEMPNVNRILKLCLEIYMARESKELELEEDLFAKLLYLYRSPETLIKWTKYKRLKTS